MNENSQGNAEALSIERRQEILQELGSTTCAACGKTKKRKMSHCRTCYFKLPGDVRKGLYKRFGSGYEEVYEQSLKLLRNYDANSEHWAVECPECGRLYDNPAWHAGGPCKTKGCTGITIAVG